MPHNKTISFIIPVYKESGLFLPRCLHSILENQDYPYIHVIVVYDGVAEKEQMQTALRQIENHANSLRRKISIMEDAGKVNNSTYKQLIKAHDAAIVTRLKIQKKLADS